MRGIPSNTPSIKRPRSHESDEESIASASSEEFGDLEVNENHMEGEDLEKFIKDLGQLFQVEEAQESNRLEDVSIPPLNKEVIPQKLHPLLEDCEIILG